MWRLRRRYSLRYLCPRLCDVTLGVGLAVGEVQLVDPAVRRSELAAIRRRLDVADRVCCALLLLAPDGAVPLIESLADLRLLLGREESWWETCFSGPAG